MADIDTLLRSSERAPDAVLARFLDAAEPDVAVAPVDAPFGRIWLGVTPRGLVRVAFGTYDDVLADLARRVSPRVLEAPARADAARRQLDEWFAGRRETFDLPLDDSLVRSEFQRRVLAAAAAIPYGGRRTYGEVAAAAGSPRATRAVGTALGTNPLCIVVPCHRVLRAGGVLGGYAGSPAVKQWLLDREAGAGAGAS